MAVSNDDYAAPTRRRAEIWARKPLLRRVYGDFYRWIIGRLVSDEAAPTLEIGSGQGFIKQFKPNCITSDLFAGPGIDCVQSAYQLDFADATLSNLILFDVWHHLEFPGAALQEFARVVRPGGRVVLLEPAAGSLLGRLAFGPLHAEPINPPRPIDWTTRPSVKPAGLGYYAAQGNCWRMFAALRLPAEVRGWRLVAVELRSAISYLGSGGFSGPQLYPTCAYPLVRRLDPAFDHWPRLFATRMLVVLEKV